MATDTTDIHTLALNYFIAHQDELVEKYCGKELLFHGEELVGAYDSVGEAFDQGCRTFGAGNFSLQTCIPGEEAYTATISTLGLIG